MRDRFVRFAGLDAENASEEIVGEHTAPGVCFARFAEAVARLFDVALRVRLERLVKLFLVLRREEAGLRRSGKRGGGLPRG